MSELDPQKVKRVLRYRWVVFATLAIIYFFVYFHRVSPAVMAKDLMTAFGVGAASIGLLGSVYFYAYALMQIPTGIMSDRIGPRKIVTIFTVVAAIGALLTGISTSFSGVVFGRLLIGIGVAVVYIPVMKVLAEWFRKNEFATGSGILLAVGNIGALSAAGPLAFLSANFGWQTVFVGLGVFTLVLAVLCYALVRDRPQEMGLPSIGEIEATEAVASHATSVSPSTTAAKEPRQYGLGESIKMILSERSFWPLAVWFFFMYGSLMAYQGLWAGPYFRDVLGWDKVMYGGLITLIGVGMVFGCPIGGYLADKVFKSRKKVLIVGTLVYTILWAVIWATAGSPNTLLYSVVYFLFGFFGGFFVVCYAQIKTLYPLSLAGTSTATLNFFPFFGGAVLQQVTSYVIASYGTIGGAYTLAGYKAAWLLLTVGMVIGTVCLFFTKERGL